MRAILLIIALFFTMSTASLAQDVTLLYSSRTFQIYHIVEDHFDLVHFDGTMDAMSAFFLFTALEYTDSKYLSMNSTGGYMDEAYILGSFLQERPNITFVVRNDNICLSACAFAALSANKVMIGKNGLEFHAPYIPYVNTDMSLNEFSLQTQTSLLSLIKYLNKTGYGIDFLNILINYTNKDSFAVFYSIDDLQKYKVSNFFERITSNINSYTLITR